MPNEAAQPISDRDGARAPSVLRAPSALPGTRACVQARPCACLLTSPRAPSALSSNTRRSITHPAFSPTVAVHAGKPPGHAAGASELPPPPADVEDDVVPLPTPPSTEPCSCTATRSAPSAHKRFHLDSSERADRRGSPPDAAMLAHTAPRDATCFISLQSSSADHCRRRPVTRLCVGSPSHAPGCTSTACCTSTASTAQCDADTARQPSILANETVGAIVPHCHPRAVLRRHPVVRRPPRVETPVSCPPSPHTFPGPTLATPLVHKSTQPHIKFASARPLHADSRTPHCTRPGR